MTFRHGCWTVLALVHLTLVACWASAVELASSETTFGKVLALYGSLSGAEKQFGFFSSDAGPAMRASFVLSDDDGTTWTEPIQWGINRESEIRFNNTVATMLGLYDDDLWEVRSAAATALARHPTASRVEIRFEYYYTPTMAAYQIGDRPAWLPVEDLVFRFSRAEKGVNGGVAK